MGPADHLRSIWSTLCRRLGPLKAGATLATLCALAFRLAKKRRPAIRNAHARYPLLGWDKLMIGSLETGGWEQSFIAEKFCLSQSVGDLGNILRSFLLKELQDPTHRLRVRLCRSNAQLTFEFSQESAETLVDRCLIGRDPPSWDSARDTPLVDGFRLIYGKDAIVFAASHAFFDGANAWKLLHKLFDNGLPIPCPHVQYSPLFSEFRACYAVALALQSGRSKASLRKELDDTKKPINGDFSIDMAPMRELRRSCGVPFAAVLAGVLSAAIFQNLEDAGKTVPDRLCLGVLVGFEVPASSHFNEYGVVPIVLHRPAQNTLGASASAVCREAGSQLLKNAVLAETSWLAVNVYNRDRLGVLDVYASLDFVVSCAPLTGTDASAPLTLRGTQAKLSTVEASIFITMPLYCIAQSFDSKVVCSFVSRALDVNLSDVDGIIRNWAKR